VPAIRTVASLNSSRSRLVSSASAAISPQVLRRVAGRPLDADAAGSESTPTACRDLG